LQEYRAPRTTLTRQPASFTSLHVDGIVPAASPPPGYRSTRTTFGSAAGASSDGRPDKDLLKDLDQAVFMALQSPPQVSLQSPPPVFRSTSITAAVRRPSAQEARNDLGQSVVVQTLQPSPPVGYRSTRTTLTRQASAHTIGRPESDARADLDCTLDHTVLLASPPVGYRSTRTSLTVQPGRAVPSREIRTSSPPQVRASSPKPATRLGNITQVGQVTVTPTSQVGQVTTAAPGSLTVVTATGSLTVPTRSSASIRATPARKKDLNTSLEQGSSAEAAAGDLFATSPAIVQVSASPASMVPASPAPAVRQRSMIPLRQGSRVSLNVSASKVATVQATAVNKSYMCPSRPAPVFRSAMAE
jgi:hypothetical protein